MLTIHTRELEKIASGWELLLASVPASAMSTSTPTTVSCAMTDLLKKYPYYIPAAYVSKSYVRFDLQIFRHNVQEHTDHTKFLVRVIAFATRWLKEGHGKDSKATLCYEICTKLAHSNIDKEQAVAAILATARTTKNEWGLGGSSLRKKMSLFKRVELKIAWWINC